MFLQGRNNLLHALVVFIWVVRDVNGGVLDEEVSLDLGRTGLGLLSLLAF